jgi:hypothetical protein
MKHEWGPWMEKLNIWGEAIGVGFRECALCPLSQRWSIPTPCELNAMTRSERRKRA